ncbi:MAG: DNA recombination protein RmuC [Gammaproteobacteria bacterium]
MNDLLVIAAAVVAVVAFAAALFAFLAWRAAKGGAMPEEVKGSLQVAADSSAAAKSGLSELQGALAVMQKALDTMNSSLRTDINNQLDAMNSSLRAQMADNREEMAKAHNKFRDEISSRFDTQQRNAENALTQAAQKAEELREAVGKQMDGIRESNEQKLEQMRRTVDEKLESTLQKAEKLREAVGKQMDGIREGNEQKLEQMRRTVDEKLESTLQKRLGESFGKVSERLTEVHQGLGKMQGMTDTMKVLSRVLTSPAARGKMGEEMLEGILRDTLSPEQYDKNWRPDPQSLDCVEFAIKIPKSQGEYARLPVDSKFPLADYEQYVQAAESGDDDGAQKARKRVVANFESSAKKIQKYTASPASTDFAVMFVPTEGLYAVLANEPGFFARLRQNYRIAVAGPHNFYLLLSTIKTGWQLFAVGERSSEVWQVLSEVKTEFGKFGEVLQKVKTQLKNASQNIDITEKSSEKMRDKLRDVEQIPATIAPRSAALTGDKD